MTLTVVRAEQADRPLPATVVALVAHARRVPSLKREAFAAQLAALPPCVGTIVVHTCHRVEWYGAPASCGDHPEPEAPAGAERLEDVEAVRHLIAVACGLDSVVLGEDQILHQLRETIAARHGALPLDPVLDRLFQAALHAGRRAHTWFSGPPRSLADLALDRIVRERVTLEGRAVLVAGAGRIGRIAALAAARRGAYVVVTNRTDERARILAAEVGGQTMPFAVDGALPPVDGVLVALSGPWPIGPSDARMLATGDAVVVDMSSPPSVPQALQAGLGARFVSVDDLAGSPESEPSERLRRRLDGLVSEAGRDYCRWLRARAAVPAIQAVAGMAEAHRRLEIDRLWPHLADLPPEDRQLIEQMSLRLVAGILHAPFAALNADAGGDLEQAARDLFGL
jgi:glutamyl-tRNA reductase